MLYNIMSNMIDNIPSSAIPWLFGAIVFLTFSIRATINYKKLHNPLSLYFAITGYSAFTAFTMWSIPLILTTNLDILLITNIVGDLFLYIMFVVQIVILHYLALKNKVPLKVVLVPAILLSIVGWLSHCYGYIVNGISISDGVFVYELPLIANIIQLIFLTFVFAVGTSLIKQIKRQTDKQAKIVLLSIGVLYMLSAIGGALNVILSGGSNQSPIIITSYFIGFILFTLIFVSIRLLRSIK